MIFQQKDKWGRWQIAGFGAIMCKNGEKPVVFTKIKDTAKAYFKVNAGVLKNPEGSKTKYEYNVIPCAIYGRQHNKEMFAICKKLNRADKIYFGGVYYKHKGISQDGEEIDFSELRLEYIEPYNIKRVRNWLRIMKRDEDDELFDNEEEESNDGIIIDNIKSELDAQVAVNAAKKEYDDDYDF